MKIGRPCARCSAVPFTSIVMLMLLAANPTVARMDQRPPTDSHLKQLPMTATLFQFVEQQASDKAFGSRFVQLAAKLGMQGTESGLINVDIINRAGDTPVAGALITSRGGHIDAVWRGQTSAWLPTEEVISLAESLPPGFVLRHANLGADNDEGPATVGSASYINPGPGGAGMIVGVMDRNYVGLTAAQNAGVAPDNAVRHNYNAGGFESGTSVHGTAHTETVFDHVPKAQFHLFRIGNSTQLGLAVDEAITLGVQVMSATQSFYNEGWADNSGAAAQAVSNAAGNGMLYVSSAGNRAQSHWQGEFSDKDGDRWHAWNGIDEWNGVGSRGNNKSIHLYLQWDRTGGGPDYDLYLYSTNLDLLASSTSGGDTFEEISWTNNTGSTVDLQIGIYLHSGTPAELEVFENTSSHFEYQVAASSLTSPNNSSAANCLVIGAVPFDNYADGQLTDYSSQGPTNSGARGIDLVGPTDTSTMAYAPAPYSGTSCSTPNTAGVIAALWATNPDLSATGIRLVVTHLAELFNDWGATGPDPEYGFGGVLLPLYQPNTFWVDRTAGNITDLPGLPWYYVADAVAGTPAAARLLFLGGGYREAVTAGVPRVLQSVRESAVLGTNQ